MENRCTFEKCKFSHDLKSVPCKYFHAKHMCTHGEQCRFGFSEKLYELGFRTRR